MSFAGAPEAYDSFMGRYARRLAPLFADFAGAAPGMRVLDVGAGPGALSEVLAVRLGPRYVAAAEPSPTFVEACAARVPGADVRSAPAEDLPWDDATFDIALAQLVVNFMADAEAGVREMTRVVKPGGVVAACTWDLAGEMKMLGTFWAAALELDPAAPSESTRYPFRGPDLVDFWSERAGLDDVSLEPLDVEVGYSGFDDFWAPFGGGVGPAGSYYTSLDGDAQRALRENVRQRLGASDGSLTLTARAWAVRGRRS